MTYKIIIDGMYCFDKEINTEDEMENFIDQLSAKYNDFYPRKKVASWIQKK